MAHERTFFPSPAAVYGNQQDPPYPHDFASRSQSPSRTQQQQHQQMQAAHGDCLHDFMHYNSAQNRRGPAHDPTAGPADHRQAAANMYDSDNTPQQMGHDSNNSNIDEELLRSTAKLKADIVSHPLYEHLLRAHIQCLHTAGLPPDQARALEAHLATNAHRVAIKYLMLSKGANSSNNNNCASSSATDMKLLQNPSSPKEIDEFMENYLKVLIVLRRHLEELVIPSTNTAMDALCELEQAFYDLTGLSSRDISPIINGSSEPLEDSTLDFEADDSEYGIESSYDIDRSLFEYVRMELKQNLKERYRESITAIRDEIIRKRQAGKLPGDVTILKRWWNAHSKWPYPTEEEKKKLMEETGLEMRQINNWFINHRKRNWNHRASPRPPSTGSSSNNFSSL